MDHRNIIIVWQANQTILNSRFDLPPDRTIVTYPPELDGGVHKSRIAPRSKMTFSDGDLTLVFDDTQVAVRQCGERQWNEQAIICYLIYRTFLFYDCLVPTNESTEVAPEVDAVVFQLHQNVVRHVERDGHTIPCRDTEPCEIVVHKQDIADYLSVFDHALAYALRTRKEMHSDFMTYWDRLCSSSLGRPHVAEVGGSSSGHWTP